MHDISVPPIVLVASLCLCTYFTSTQKGAFFPCPLSNFSRLRVYSNVVFSDGLARVHSSSSQSLCTSYKNVHYMLSTPFNHTFICLPHFTWEQKLRFHLYFPSAWHILDTQYHHLGSPDALRMGRSALNKFKWVKKDGHSFSTYVLTV